MHRDLMPDVVKAPDSGEENQTVAAEASDK